MAHALIIYENVAITWAIRSYLIPLGFSSFDHTWTKRQALAAAEEHRPDIIVIGDDVEPEDAIQAARWISAHGAKADNPIPVLMVCGDPARTRLGPQQASGYDGPILLNQIEKAAEMALSRQA